MFMFGNIFKLRNATLALNINIVKLVSMFIFIFKKLRLGEGGGEGRGGGRVLTLNEYKYIYWPVSSKYPFFLARNIFSKWCLQNGRRVRECCVGPVSLYSAYSLSHTFTDFPLGGLENS